MADNTADIDVDGVHGNTGSRFQRCSNGILNGLCHSNNTLAIANVDITIHGQTVILCNDDFNAHPPSFLADQISNIGTGFHTQAYNAFHIQNRITWQREKGRGAKNNWKNGMEDIWFATNNKMFAFHVDAVMIRRKVIAPYRVDGRPKGWEETAGGNFRNPCPSNFWDDISIPYWSMPENTAHPTQKPEKLLAKLILASSDPGGVVLDPFAGSGSTAVTAKKLGRHFIGIEQNEQYCVWAEKRLEMAEEDPTIQGYAGGVFWERNTAAQRRARKGKSTE